MTTKFRGCKSRCDACTVRLDGVRVRGGPVFAAQCAGSRVDTIEGVSAIALPASGRAKAAEAAATARGLLRFANLMIYPVPTQVR